MIHKILIFNNNSKFQFRWKVTVQAVITAFLITIQSFYSQLSLAQPIKENAYFGPVIENYSGIAGNFGEIRPGHFHSGIDYKTDEKEGFPVYAAADGYVSRVKVSNFGYGKALYINHPNGKTTVYGHLRAFKSDIEAHVLELQFQKEEYSQEFFPEKEDYPIKKGELIAWSGNTGGSQGPHLHFETRDTKSEKPYDPIIAGYSYPDTLAPLIKSIVVYSTGPYGALLGSQKFETRLDSNNISTIPQMKVQGESFFIGFEGYDIAGKAENNLGISHYKLQKNGAVIFEFKMGDYFFHETRYANACIDYQLKSEKGNDVYLCHKLSGNILDFFGSGDGLFKLQKNETTTLELETSDFYGNKRKVEFQIINDKYEADKISETGGTKINIEKGYFIEESKFKIQVPKNCFYETVNISYNIEKETENFTVLNLTPASLAIQNSIEISLLLPEIKSELLSKLVIVSLDSSNNMKSEGGVSSGKWLTAKTRNTGRFSIAIDTIAPITSKPSVEIDELTGKNRIIIPVRDNLAGISDYKCYIDKKWVPADYSTIRGMLIVYPEVFDSNFKTLHILVELTDKTENKSTTSFDIKN